MPDRAYLNTRLWPGDRYDNLPRIETLVLREGLTLVLSDIPAGDECAYHHVEPEDVFGIGFHLFGGSRFDMEGERFDTLPLQVQAGAAPRASTSSFVLPAHGFRTVSLRFSPQVALDLFNRHGMGGSAAAKMIGTADQAVNTMRLAPLDSTGVALVEAMFCAPYSGAGRLLYLESCAMGLLAFQMDMGGKASTPRKTAELEKKLEIAKAYLDDHLDAPPSIIQLARYCGFNDFKLKRAFKDAFGTTVFGYVRQRRMEQAIRDLHGGMSVARVSAKAGYECPRCFSDAFRRHFGMLPREVTRAALSAAPAPRI